MVLIYNHSWEQRNLIELTNRVIVGLATSVTPYYRETGVPLLRNMNLKKNYLDDSDLLFLDETYANSNESKKIQCDDVLTVHTGSNIGLTCVCPKKYDGCLSFTTLITTVDTKKLNSKFLMQYINSDNGMNRVLSIVTAGGKQNLNSGDLEKLVVPYSLNVNEQAQIGNVLCKIDDIITLHQRK